MSDTPKVEYERRRSLALAAAAKEDGLSAGLGYGRVALLVVAAWLFFSSFASSGVAWSVVGAVFVASWIAQSIVDRRQREHERIAQHYATCLARLEGKWQAFPSIGERFAEAAHPYARDLDLFGKGSLFQLLDTTRTTQGEATLARWLLAPAEAAVLASRTAMVKHLAIDVNGREALAIAALASEFPRVDERPIVAWAEQPAWKLDMVLRVATYVLPIVTTSFLIGLKLGVFPAWPFLILAAGHVAVLARTREAVNHVARFAEATERALDGLRPLLRAASHLPVEPQAAQVREAIVAVESLARRITFFQSRANLFVALIAPILLWEIHTGEALERWRVKHGPAVRKWFEALGEIEATAALATFAYEHPSWAWPDVVAEGPVFKAVSLGHPLIGEAKCVVNDVELAGAGAVLLVTGSNMSGKSTLLRSLGLSAVMAQSGLPVRASSLTMSRAQIATVMRVADSLQEGASFFYAEVRRLKSVVDLLDAPLPVLFLLDEILQGTNTRERSLGARDVVKHLSARGSTGLVSTHDLSLVQLGDALGPKLRFAHFTDAVEGDRMTFDYKLRDGVVRSTNALRLMKAVGLPVEAPDAPTA